MRLKARLLERRQERFGLQAEKAAPYMGRKELIQYYLKDNRLREVNWLGFGWYADCLFEERRATLYQWNGRSCKITWKEDWDRLEQEDKSSGARVLQAVFHLSKKHIGIGSGQICLDSWSQCFGAGLFKYGSLNGNGKAEFCVRRDAKINVVRVGGEYESLQRFVQREEPVDFCEFAIDFSRPRGKDRKNFSNWYRGFMKDDFLSDSEYKKMLTMSEREFSMDFVYRLLKKEAQSRVYTLMVSPIADGEVVSSGGVWGEVAELCEERLRKDRDGGDVYEDGGAALHVSLDEEELCQLLYGYYQEIARRRKGPSADFVRKYEEKLTQIERIVSKLGGEDASVEGEGESDAKKRQAVMEYLRARMEMWRGLPQKKPGVKVRAILSFIAWKEEDIPAQWGVDNIYRRQRKGQEAMANLGIDLYKQVLQWARQEAGYGKE